MSTLLEKNGTTTAEVTMINARGILLFVGGKEYYLSYDRYPWFRNAKVCVGMQSMWILRSTA